MKTESALPPPSSVKVPVIPNVPAAESYTPSVRVVPPSSVGTVAVVVRPAASLDAVIKSFLAVVSKPASVTRHAVPPPLPVYPPLVSYIVPVTSAHFNPVIEAPPPGLKPTCPVITEVGTSEIAEPAKTAKLSAVKRSTLVVIANTFVGVVIKVVIKTIRGIKISRNEKTKVLYLR